MAKITAPFLSMSARGSIGKTLVAGAWKGVSYMRQHVTPANPSTPAQVAQRAIMAYVTKFWGLWLSGTTVGIGWETYAKTLGSALSGFNLFARSAMRLAVTAPASSFVTSLTNHPEGFDDWTVHFNMADLNTGSIGTESGFFNIWRGQSTATMVLWKSVEITTGYIDTGPFTPGTFYFQIKKDGVPRSGLVVHTTP